MPPAARANQDITACPLMNPGPPPVPHTGGTIKGPADRNVKIGGFPAAIEDDTVPCVGAEDKLLKVEAKVQILRKAPARKGDTTAHGAKIVSGCETVHIGDTLQGAALMKAGGPLVQVCEEPGGAVMV